MTIMTLSVGPLVTDKQLIFHVFSKHKMFRKYVPLFIYLFIYLFAVNDALCLFASLLTPACKCMTHFFNNKMFWFALFSPLAAKDRDEEGVSEVGEADGSGVRGASRERSQSCERSPVQYQPEQQNYRWTSMKCMFSLEPAWLVN